LVSGDFFDFKPFSEKLVEALDEYSPDLIAMAGFMCYWQIPEKYAGKVMNIHPALIPAFCGEGLYGHYVHEAVIEYGAKVSGCTVHFADNQYDHGPIILQRVIEVKDDDTADTLADRVFQEECIAYPQAIQLFAQGRLEIKGRPAKGGPAPARRPLRAARRGRRRVHIRPEQP
jgi:folate-dependent phosphoribosylglycinamide formyltransferase PurN